MLEFTAERKFFYKKTMNIVAQIKYHPLPLISLAFGIYGHVYFLDCLIIPSTQNKYIVWMQYSVYYYWFLMLILAQLGCILKDPGYVVSKKEERSLSKVPDDCTYCDKCQIVRPVRAHHCKICRRCVKNMDHHCPWICNCVGAGNMKYFILFLLYTAIFPFHCLFVLFFYYCVGFLDNVVVNNCDLSTKLHLIFLFCAAVFVCIFAVVMLNEMLRGLVRDETTIEAIIRRRLNVKITKCKKTDGDCFIEEEQILKKMLLYRKPNRPIDLTLREIFGESEWTSLGLNLLQVPLSVGLLPVVHMLIDLNKMHISSPEDTRSSLQDCTFYKNF